MSLLSGRRAARVRAVIGGSSERQRMMGTFGDYAVSSASNFLLTIAVAKSSTAKGFGAFALVYGLFLVALGVARSLIGEPLLVVARGGESLSETTVARRAASESVFLGLCCSLLFLFAGLASAGTMRQPLLLFAVFMPALVVQDNLRYVSFALGCTARALLSDAVWLGVQLPIFAYLIASGGSGGAVVLGWLLSGSVAGFVGLRLSGIHRRLPTPRVPASRTLGLRYLGEFLTSLGAGQLILLMVGLLAGLEGTGALRGGQVILGPLIILQTAVPAMAIPLCARTIMVGRSIVPRCRVVSMAMFVLALVWGAAALLIPPSVGIAVLGETWASARALIIPQALIVGFQGISLGAMVGLRATLSASASLKLRLALAPVYVVGAGVGAALGGASLAIWCWAAMTPIGSFFWWRLLRRTADVEIGLNLDSVAAGSPPARTELLSTDRG